MAFLEEIGCACQRWAVGLELLARMEPLVTAFDTAIEHTRLFRDMVSGTVRVSAAAHAGCKKTPARESPLAGKFIEGPLDQR
ncbi:hypothetical protein CWS72_01865 [Telmatospirillum siberiense]|uniref:Uncharacterized protein n=1 Tax=Telmatospirillum siberiense TaxID=382514 RepID=A0A2N3Q1S5_9PROT|nr:hypothetical protein CWS72_01865 [Telmatospirillum siberiense]